VESINGDEDSLLGIDLKVYKDDVLVYLIQIKPYTAFYKSPKVNDALIIDRKRWFEKQKTAMLKYPEADYRYILYVDNGDGRLNWINKDGNYKHKIEELSTLGGEGLLTFGEFMETKILIL
jgi:hypothetical protein